MALVGQNGLAHEAGMIRKMNLVDLETYLERPACPRCNAARTRAIDTKHGTHLMFQCPIPKCQWTAFARLPDIRKKIIYLDTSIVSHMARAISRNDRKSPWQQLHHVLRRATALEVIVCPGSLIVENEAEFSRSSTEIIRLSRELGDPGLKHELEIRDQQILRVLDRFLAGEEPENKTELDPTVAFNRNVHAWLPVYNVTANTATPEGWIASRRDTKAIVRDELERIYKEYALSDVPFEDIWKAEASGYGRGIVAEAKQCIRRRLALEPIPAHLNVLGIWIPNTFDTLINILQGRSQLSYLDAAEKAEAFLMSDHVRLIPVASIKSKLHAGLAMLCRGSSPRIPTRGDSFDIDHIASYAPYVDIMIADRFFADLCNQNHMRIGEPYGTEIRRLGVNEVESFVKDIEKLIGDARQATLAERVSRAIQKGGFQDEFAKKIAKYVQQHSVQLPTKHKHRD